MFKKLLAVCAATLLTLAGYAAAVELRDDHPDTYVVQKGDTLWDISARFLNEPWLWPEIWQANPQVENPHLIYPGDVLSLAYIGGRPTLIKKSPQIRRVGEEAINAIPLGDVRAFLRSLHVLDDDTYNSLPYVVGLEDNHLRVTEDQIAYVRRGQFPAGQRFSVVRPTLRYAVRRDNETGETSIRRDPWTAQSGARPTAVGVEWAYYAFSDSNYEILGWEVMEVASGVITRDGDPATLLITPGGSEVAVGDLLLPFEEEPYDLTFYPHAMSSVPEHLKLLAVTERISFGGPRDVIAISGGAREGIENGHVFSIYQPGERVVDRIQHSNELIAKRDRNKVQLPDEFIGHAMVFRTFDRVSYALIMDAIRPAQVGDRLMAPDRLPSPDPR